MRLLAQFRFLKNFYVATSLGLVIWLLFFEVNGIPEQINNWENCASWKIKNNIMPNKSDS